MGDPPFESRVAMQRFVLESLDEMVSLLKAIDHPQRLQILTLMASEPKTFADLQEKTELQKSALGNHLNVLISKNLVQKLERGVYRLSFDGESILEYYARSFLEIKLREQERLEKIQRLIGRYTTYGDDTMKSIDVSNLDVRIVELDPMRVASVQAISKSPENDAWKKIQPWAEKLGLFDDLEKHPVFGFNNPDPSPGKEEYGYEFWVRVEPEIEPEGEIEVKEFSGGLYAVTTTRLIVNDDNIIPAWKQLGEWVKESKEYDFGEFPCLERALNPRASPENLILDLYCPIKER
ncbi:MAG: effector binding domain-containing protein [Candidatus Thorarchaeota archaeon]